MEKSRRRLKLLSLAAVLSALLLRESRVVTGIVLVCAGASLLLLWRELPGLSGVSQESIKLKSLRTATLFTFGYFGAIAALAVLLERLGAAGRLDFLTEKHIKLFMAVILAVPMLFLGNIAPRLPFNRYTGLRLPWTVRDEECWLIAHRVLGYVSLPLALLLFAQVPTDMTLEHYGKRWFMGVILLWIGVPGLLSGWHYWNKYRG